MGGPMNGDQATTLTDRTRLHYLDTSALLAWLMEGREVLQPLEGAQEVASSTLLWTEVSRALHRSLQTGRLSPVDATEVRHNFARIGAGIKRLRLSDSILRRAEGPYPLVIRTLDAIHLAAAELWLDEASDRDADPGELSVWSLDERMNHCASQLGFQTPLLTL